MLDEDVLALIPISSKQFSTTFTDGSTYIYRTRNYNGPVDISKISIQLINPMGQLADTIWAESAEPVDEGYSYKDNFDVAKK